MHYGSIESETKANLVYQALKEHSGHWVDAGQLAVEVARRNGDHFLNALGTRVSEVREQLVNHPERREFIPPAKRVGQRFFYALMPVEKIPRPSQLALGV